MKNLPSPPNANAAAATGHNAGFHIILMEMVQNGLQPWDTSLNVEC
jgi:hypothetical protein